MFIYWFLLHKSLGFCCGLLVFTGGVTKCGNFIHVCVCFLDHAEFVSFQSVLLRLGSHPCLLLDGYGKQVGLPAGGRVLLQPDKETLVSLSGFTGPPSSVD